MSFLASQIIQPPPAAWREIPSWDRVVDTVNSVSPKHPWCPGCKTYFFSLIQPAFKRHLEFGCSLDLVWFTGEWRKQKIWIILFVFQSLCFLFAHLFQWLLTWSCLITSVKIPSQCSAILQKQENLGTWFTVFCTLFLNLGLFCACYIALFNVHHLIVFLHYFSITESRDQRIFTFLFKHGFLLC